MTYKELLKSFITESMNTFDAGYNLACGLLTIHSDPLNRQMRTESLFEQYTKMINENKTPEFAHGGLAYCVECDTMKYRYETDVTKLPPPTEISPEDILNYLD